MEKEIEDGDLVQMSQQMLDQARKEEADSIREEIASLDRAELSEGLETDDEKKAFWLNIYNAYIQILLREDSSRYRLKFLFFRRRYVEVAGKKMSLDKIEHGMLRGSKLSFAFGYLGNPLAGRFERDYRVKEIDPRIHFALNCGAKTCPPIKFYSDKEIDEELDNATENYLGQEVEVRDDKVSLPKVFYWFRGDFGGKKGIREFLEDFDIENRGKKLEYSHWNWELDLDAFEE